MKSLFYLFLFAKLLLTISYCENRHYDWVHEVSDLKPDSRIIYGKLENGFRYVFMPNKQLPKHFSVRLYVNAGSMMEEENERGLAHFLEHMSFKGIRGYPEDKMIQTLQHLGVSFGTHNNAYTDFDKTVYKLDLMDNSDSHLDHSLKILSGIADGMILDETLIKKERGVILAEKRDTDNVGIKVSDDYRKFLQKELRINERLPIGVESVIKSANGELLRNFYKKWYRPERMILVIVGDLNQDAVESRIKENFSAFSGLSEAPSEPNWGELEYNRGLRSKIYKDKELEETVVVLVSLTPYQKDKIANKENRKEVIYRSIAYSILNARMQNLAKEEKSLFHNGYASSDVSFDIFRQSTITLQCGAEQVLEALKVAENELRRVFEYGFTDEEFNRFKKEELFGYKNRIHLDETSKTGDLIDSLFEIVLNSSVFTTYAFDYEFAKEFLEKEANKEKCLEVFKNSWDLVNLSIYLATNCDSCYTETGLNEAYNLSKEIELKAPEENEIVEYHYKGESEKGSIIEESYNENLDCYQYRLSNNVRINIKQTNFDKNGIYYRIDFGNGKDDLGAGPEGIKAVASYILREGGIGQLSKEKIYRAFAGNGIFIPCINIENDVFNMIAAIKNEDFEGQMNLICGYFMEPAYLDDGLKQMHVAFRNYYSNLNKTANGIMELEVYPYLTNNHPEYGVYSLENLIARTPQEVKEWMKDPLTKSYMEITLVGDFNKDEILESLLNTLGTLPERDETKKCYEEMSEVVLREGLAKRVFGYQSEIPQASCMVYWPGYELTDDNKQIIEYVKTDVLAAVLDERLRQKVRMELGEGYSPVASICFADHIYAQTMTDPNKAHYLCDLMTEIAASLATEKITEDEFNRVILAKLLEKESNKFTNVYWLNHLARMQEDPSLIQDEDFRDNYYKNLTLKEVNQAAKKYFQPSKAVQVMIVPEPYRFEVVNKIKNQKIKKICGKSISSFCREREQSR